MKPIIELNPIEINNAVNNICCSNDFNTKLQLCKLLKYLVRETLEGREERLKGYNIGLEVFNKPENFDPDQDPLVRIHAGRLRRALRLYYLESGINDPIKIEIPKGKYIPYFYIKETFPNNQKNTSSSPNNLIHEASVAIIPFKNLSGIKDKDYFAVGFAEELSVELIKFDDLKVFANIATYDNISEYKVFKICRNKGIRFIVNGAVYFIGDKIKLLIKLIDLSCEEQIWAESYTLKLTSKNLTDIQETISREIACKIGSEYGIILHKLSTENKGKKPKTIQTIDAILRFHYYEETYTPESAFEAFEALQEAIKNEPDIGTTRAFLASLYLSKYMFDLPDANNSITQFKKLTEEAYKVDPNNLTVRIALTYKYFALNEKERFFNEVEKCLSMGPITPLRLGVLGQYLCLYGDWEKGKKLLDKVMNMNVNFPQFLFGTTTLYYYRIKAYKEALVEANQYNMPALFWSPLLRIATLGQLGKIEEAAPNIEQLKQLKPDFEVKARLLLSRFIKEDELVEHVIEGLQKTGMVF